MKNSTQKTGSLSKIYCNLFGHNYEITKEITYYVKEYKCKHCNHELTTSSNGSLVELTPKLKEINSVLNRIHSSKQARLKNRRRNEPYFL